MASAILFASGSAYATSAKTIEMVADNIKLTLMVGEDNRLYQLGFGDASKKLRFRTRLRPARWNFFRPTATVS